METEKTSQPNTFVKISIIENDFEAQLIESILKEREIPHRIHSYHDTAYDGLFQTQKGWGKIEAPQSYKSIIIDIINQIRNDSAEHDSN